MAEQIIGFTGLAGAGKDTAARAMLGALHQHDRPAIIDSFAASIREISRLCCLDPYDRRYKEAKHTFTMEGFCDALQYGIDAVLGGKLPAGDRAALYSHTVDALAPFMWEGWGGTDISLSPREFMQVLGTEGGQRVRQTLWVELAERRWRNYAGVVLVPDVRFSHELALLDRLILVTRPGVEPVNGHPSEHLAATLTQGRTGSSPFLRRLYNGGSAAKLAYRARKMAGRLARGQSW